LGVKNFDFFAKNDEKSVYFLHKSIKLTFLTIQRHQKTSFFGQNLCIRNWSVKCERMLNQMLNCQDFGRLNSVKFS